jgi:hypothetical protein
MWRIGIRLAAVLAALVGAVLVPALVGATGSATRTTASHSAAVSAKQEGQWTVGIKGTPSVLVGNIPTTQPVSGTVNVGNLPAVQHVAVDNLPGTQTIGGTVNVGSVAGTVTTKPVEPGTPFSVTVQGAGEVGVGITNVGHLAGNPTTFWLTSVSAATQQSTTEVVFLSNLCDGASGGLAVAGPEIVLPGDDTRQLTFPRPYELSPQAGCTEGSTLYGDTPDGPLSITGYYTHS